MGQVRATTKASAGKTKSSSTGKGNPWIGGTIGEAAMGASKTKTFLGAVTGGS